MQIAKCMIRLNLNVDPVRTQLTRTQNMNISEMNAQNSPNMHVYSLDESKLKIINADKTLSYVCSTY